jgi:prophage tail gpP-like protein
MTEGIYIFCNGQELTAYNGLTVTESVETIASGFSVTSPNTATAERVIMPIRPWDEVQIEESGSVVLIGYCDNLSGSLGATENTLTASGRSLIADAVDSSADVKSEIRGVNVKKIAEIILKPFGIPVSVAAGVELGDPFDKFGIEPGEKAFDAILRALKERGLLATTIRETGGVEIVKPRALAASDSLIEGKNILSISPSWTTADRFSEYRVLGQSPPKRDPIPKKAPPPANVATSGAGWYTYTAPIRRTPKQSNSADGRVKDSEVPRYRPLIIEAEKRTSTAQAEKLAVFEAGYRAGKSSAIGLGVAGWRQSNGEPWRANMTVRVTLPSFGIEDLEMLIGSLSLSYSNSSGAKTELQLVALNTFDANPGDVTKGKKSVFKKSGRLVYWTWDAEKGTGVYKDENGKTVESWEK